MTPTAAEDQMMIFSTTIPQSLHQKLKETAARRRETIQDITAKALEEWLQDAAFFEEAANKVLGSESKADAADAEEVDYSFTEEQEEALELEHG
jgi:formate dehydrogenase maturation protein FdhE